MALSVLSAIYVGHSYNDFGGLVGDAIYSEVSGPLCDLLKYTSAQLKGMHFSEVQTAASRRAAMTFYTCRQMGRYVPPSYVVEMIRGDGTVGNYRLHTESFFSNRLCKWVTGVEPVADDVRPDLPLLSEYDITEEDVKRFAGTMSWAEARDRLALLHPDISLSDFLVTASEKTGIVSLGGGFGRQVITVCQNKRCRKRVGVKSAGRLPVRCSSCDSPYWRDHAHWETHGTTRKRRNL